MPQPSITPMSRMRQTDEAGREGNRLTATLKKAREEAGLFLTGGGKARALMRAHEWSKSPLGAPDTWPGPLKLVVGLLLDSMFPMFVAWGPELSLLYNDAYAEILGAKHPASLGVG